MKKGDVVSVEQGLYDIIVLKDFKNGFLLGARPNFRDASIYAKNDTGKPVFTDYKKEDIEYCLKTLTGEFLSYDDYIEEISKLMEILKARISNKLQNDNIAEPYLFDDICKAVSLLYSDDNVFEYTELLKLKKYSNEHSFYKIVNQEDMVVEYAIGNGSEYFYTPHFGITE